MDHDIILKSLAGRNRRWGIRTAADYVNSFTGCLGDGFCPTSLMGVSGEQWGKCLKEAANRLTYANEAMVTKGIIEPGINEADVPDGGVMAFDCIITTTRRDRDGDILESSGATLDMKMPLLWQHLPLQPIGKFLKETGRNKKYVGGRFAIADTELGRDAAALVKFGALRISHGFQPSVFEPLADEKSGEQIGWKIHRFDVLEVSVVSIPSNLEAEILTSVSKSKAFAQELDGIRTAYGRDLLKTDLVKRWAKHIHDNRPTVVAVQRAIQDNFGLTPKETEALTPLQANLLVKDAPCGCQKSHKKDLNIGDRVSLVPGAERDGLATGAAGNVWSLRIRDNGDAVALIEFDDVSTLREGADLWFPVSELHKAVFINTRKAHDLSRPAMQSSDTEPPERWNRKLSKSFDVALEYLQPTKLEYDWVSRYLNCEIKNIFQNSTIVPTARIGSWLTGLRHVTADSKVDDIRNIEGDKERPPEYEVIQLNSKQNDDFLIDGISFHHEGRSKYVINVSPCYAGLYVIVYTSVDDKSENREIISKTWEWAVENNFLKGEAFSLSGEFLPRTGQNFGEVFLPEKNEKPLRRCVELINAKGKAAANRGMILMGPPGTGKTLSGRILKDQAKSTFIWVSSRDFYYMGAFGGFAYGFELARELAPCILFVEDVDNWLTDRTLDFLKTEMDGIGRSTGVTTILTTNYPERLPEALIDRPGRFHDVLKFDLPTSTERKRMLEKWIDGITTAELTQAVAKTDGYSGAHLYELANFAKTLKEEEDCSLSSALTKALEKITEQRELINESQLSGSNYRPRKSLPVSGNKHMANIADATITVKLDASEVIAAIEDIERLHFASLIKDTRRMREYRDRLSTVLEAHRPEWEFPVDSGLDALLGLAAAAP